MIRATGLVVVALAVLLTVGGIIGYAIRCINRAAPGLIDARPRPGSNGSPVPNMWPVAKSDAR
jgi:hypothetical protein